MCVMMQNNDLTERLEAIVDASTLFDTLECLVGVCCAKSYHLKHDWQDERSARVWAKAAKALDRLTLNQTIRSI
jgi:hypothetical protein